MTALIGGLCVGALWGIWATRQLIKRRRDILSALERKRLMMLKLEVLHKQQEHGKSTKQIAGRGTAQGEGTTGEAATGTTGETGSARSSEENQTGSR